MHVFLAGASRGVGREIAKQLVIENYQVTALLRSAMAKDELSAMGVTVAMGDALNADGMKQLLIACQPAAVISTVGGLPDDNGIRADFAGNKNLIDAAVAAAGAKRFILISSIGSGNSAIALPPAALDTLGAVLKEKEQAEQYLADSGLTYTVIRPGGLISQPATNQEVLTEDPSIAGSIPRTAVAKLSVRALSSEKANNKVFSAIDRSMQRNAKDFEIVEL